jgi:hypothetical protein
MTEQEKITFINELVEKVKSEILKKVKYMPDNWDGIELRQYISDRFANVVIKGTMNRKRRLDYNNRMMVENNLYF